MALLAAQAYPEVVLRLGRDLTRVLKRGNPWVFADALRELPDAPAGSQAVLLDNKRGRPVARGFYEPKSPLAFRACHVDDERPLNEHWAQQRFEMAVAWRQRLFGDVTQGDRQTTGFRLFNGEGDGVPGLVVDVYDRTAVIKLDGPAAARFWDIDGITEWLRDELSMQCVCERPRQRGAEPSMRLGELPTEPVAFLENGMRFTTDIVHGQKTGFFLDQRDNRWRIRQVAQGQRVLNLFGYTGGFSIAAGCGQAQHVTTVDLAQPAVAAANMHWRLNELPSDSHEGVAADVFDYLNGAKSVRRQWDIVISDPPSFAPSKATVTQASAAYQRLACECAAVTVRGGLLALASCSSHIPADEFLRINEEGISQARRRAIVLGLHGQPIDHPTPLALPEFRYLKFCLFRIE